MADNLGLDETDADTVVQAELDNFGLGTCYIEQIYRNGEETIHRLDEDGIQVIVSDHNLEGSEEEDGFCWDDDNEEDDD